MGLGTGATSARRRRTTELLGVLTARERQILDYVRTFLADEGYLPTTREVTRGCGLASPTGWERSRPAKPCHIDVWINSSCMGSRLAVPNGKKFTQELWVALAGFGVEPVQVPGRQRCLVAWRDSEPAGW